MLTKNVEKGFKDGHVIINIVSTYILKSFKRLYCFKEKFKRCIMFRAIGLSYD